MSRLSTGKVVASGYTINQLTRWLEENRKDSKYRCTNLPSNVVIHEQCINELVERGEQFTMDVESTLLGELVHDLAWERSAWTFLISKTSNDDPHRLRGGRLIIFDGVEPIGIVDHCLMANTLHEYGVSIRNERIKQDLQKKDSRETTILKRAKQIINVDVYGLTSEELLMQGTKNIKGAVDMATHKLGRTMQEKFTPVSEWVREQLMHFSPEMIAVSEKMGKAEIVNAYTEAVEDNALGAGVKKDMDVGQGKMVIILGDEYHIAHLSGLTNVGGEFHKRYMRFNRDTLDPGLHTALALLKLTEPNTFIRGMGFKVSDTEYFIVEEVQIEHD